MPRLTSLEARRARYEQIKVEARKRLEAGERLKWVNAATGYRFEKDHGDREALAVPSEVIGLLEREKCITRSDDGDTLEYSTPEREAQKEAAYKAELAARRRARLDRWANAVAVCFRSDATIYTDSADLDAALEKISNEAMTLGSLED